MKGTLTLVDDRIPTQPQTQLCLMSGGRAGASRGFQADLVKMMYGYGDEYQPSQDTVDLMESLVQDYILEMCTQVRGVERQ